jgi:signal transduction histidine kinase
MGQARQPLGDGEATDVTGGRAANDELSALRHVATLAAEGAAPRDLFAVAAEEVARVVHVPLVIIARYETDGTATQCAGFPGEDSLFPVGKRWSLDGTNVLSLVHTNSGAARIDDYAQLDGQLADAVRRVGIRSTVGTPIVVAGRIWGAVVVSSRKREPLPQDTAARLASFTELLAAAIANAESREAVERLADEQAALRRVATLVAKGVAPSDLFAVVSEEVARFVNVPRVSVARYERDGSATHCASFPPGGPILPVGKRWSLEGTNVLKLVRASSAAARIDDYSQLDGELAETVRRLGIRSTVGVPIVVAGRLWGAMVVSTTEHNPLLDGTAASLASFTELLATAIASAESREALGRLADEQAALRRVATLVAQGVPPAEIFLAVSEEVDRLFGLDEATVGRFDPDGPAFIVLGAAKSVEGIPIGSRWEINDLYVSSKVFRTGRSARVDATDLASIGGPTAATLRRLHLVSQVGSPIIVAGRLWGAVTVVAGDESLPLDTEDRLEKFAELAATAIANAASASELAASRRRIVAASDDTRRRIERDLHDGTQQRLVSLALTARNTEARLPPDRSDIRSELSQIATGLRDAVAELQEISRGIHPAILSHGGLGPALRTLTRRSAIPVELDITTEARFPEPIEVAAYFIASEALANAAKHAQASHIEVALWTSDGTVLLSIRDNGIGGADPARGSGLVGLNDRVEALGGSIHVRSGADNGTQITAQLPLELDLAEDAD